MTDLTIMHAPLHGPSATRATVNRALSHRADSVGFSEGYRIKSDFRHRLTYRCTMGNPDVDGQVGVSDRDNARGAYDVPILTKRKHKGVERLSVRACRASEPIKIAPPRWISLSVFKVAGLGTVAHFNLHPHAAIAGFLPTNDRVRQYRRQMMLLKSMIEDEQAKGRIIVVTGDLNFPYVPDAHAPEFSPQRVAADLGLKVYVRRIDWILYDRRLRLAEPVEVIDPATNPGTDHPWLIARFVKHPPRVADLTAALHKSIAHAEALHADAAERLTA